MDDELRAVVLDLRALLAELERDPAPVELLCEFLSRVRVLLRNEAVEHLDDRHLGTETLEDRCELAADDPPAEDNEAARHTVLRKQARRADTARGIDPVDRRPERI